jgi:hypothetical protein
MKWSTKKTQYLKPLEDIIGEVHTSEKMIWRGRVKVIVDLENESWCLSWWIGPFLTEKTNAILSAWKNQWEKENWWWKVFSKRKIRCGWVIIHCYHILFSVTLLWILVIVRCSSSLWYIIDILQDYDISKKLEHAYKSLQADPTSISAVDPKLYSKRFRDFIHRIFIEDK